MAEGYPARRDVIKRAAKIGIVTVGLGMASAPATQARPLTQHERAVAGAEQTLTTRLQDGSPVSYEANFDAYWSPRGSQYSYQYDTTTPLIKRVDGVKRYFKVEQLGTTRQTLQARIIPLGRMVRVESEVSSSPLVVSSETPDNDPNHVMSQSGVVALDAHAQPTMTVRQRDGDMPTVPLQTRAVNANSIIV